MHGRPRKPLSAPDSAVVAAKSAKLKDLQSQLLNNHRNKLYTKEAVEASAKLLEMNPEVYTAWNFRKLALQHNAKGVEEAEVLKGFVNEELRTILTGSGKSCLDGPKQAYVNHLAVEIALRRNPKSYGAWHHRKWVLGLGLSEIDFDREFRLLDQLLSIKTDPRNFHGWNYRRFVAKLKSVPEVEELKFTMDMINDEFSNYSAWHNRSVILSQLLEKKADGFKNKESILTEEYELVRQALFTDPNDQSGWFYHLWLLKQTITIDNIQIISSWPSHKSNWYLSIRNNKVILYPSSNMDQHYILHRGLLPIILYFNEAVSGINSSNVIVSSTFVDNEGLIWTPLSANRSTESHCWVSFIKISEPDLVNSDSSTVEIIVGNSSGIISTSGSRYSHPLKFKFTISLKSINEDAIKEASKELFIWNENATEYDFGCVNQSSFENLSIIDKQESEVTKWNLDTLSYEIELFKELSEENCKFAKLTLARLFICENKLTQRGKRFEEILELFDDLVKLDPTHAKYYLDQRSLILLNQVTSDKLCAMKYSTQSRYAGFRLSRLGLTKIGSVNNLLWVQMLDLSHNELQSIEGLEALQLLICLNLSNNRINSFASLAPLKLLKSLKALNISSNEIGSHPVDTWRYLCASPLSHTYDFEQDIIEELKKHTINLKDYWEVILLFKNLDLVQLDIGDNGIVDGNFSRMLKIVIPTLKWLDGVEL